jgi:hypothetical protein
MCASTFAGEIFQIKLTAHTLRNLYVDGHAPPAFGGRQLLLAVQIPNQAKIIDSRRNLNRTLCVRHIKSPIKTKQLA